MASPIRMTSTVQSVLGALIGAAERETATYGLQVCQETGLGSGTVYPILRRLERIGWVRTYWEEDGPETSGPRRRMYELSSEGRAGIAAAQRGRKQLRLGWTS